MNIPKKGFFNSANCAGKEEGQAESLPGTTAEMCSTTTNRQVWGFAEAKWSMLLHRFCFQIRDFSSMLNAGSFCIKRVTSKCFFCAQPTAFWGLLPLSRIKINIFQSSSKRKSMERLHRSICVDTHSITVTGKDWS